METKVISAIAEPEKAAEEAARLLLQGEVVAIPTETVYGLAGDIYREDAIKNIYTVKGRPQDNPIIVHISSMEMLEDIVSEIPDSARALAKEFWPGPLTIIFKKSDRVLPVITCGMDTVAVRFPSHPAARAIIAKAGVPLAAPSANLSGKPSPTTAAHCVQDLSGRIPLIVDGGACDVGVESTVITVAKDVPTILRPGIISLEDIKHVLPDAVISEAVRRKVGENEKVESPGLKYKHYSPNCDVTLVKGELKDFVSFIENLEDKEGCFAMCFSGEEESMPVPAVAYGEMGDGRSQAHNVFAILREMDEKGAKKVFVRAPLDDGRSMAVSNRLIRAAGFKVVEV